MNDITSEEYKRGFIIGMTMNPLMVTTETAAPQPTPQSDSGVILMDGATGLFGLAVINNTVLCADGTEGGV